MANMSLIRRHGSPCTCNDHKTSVDRERSGRGLMCKDVSASGDQGLSEILAAKLAIDALDKYSVEPLPQPACSVHAEDLERFPFRVFDLLDRTLFRGVLSGEVYLKWSPLPEDIHGITSKPGVSDTRTMIQLNTDLLTVPPVVLLTVLIHHMAHAYFLVCCGFKENSADQDKYDLEHGVLFSTLMYQITEVVRPSEKKEKKKLPDLTQWATHRAPLSPQIARVLMSRLKPPRGASYCSLLVNDHLRNESCRGQVEILRNMEISELMGEKRINNPFPISHYFHTADPGKSTFAPVLRKRQQFNPAEELELLYASYAIPFPKGKLKDFPSLNALSENSQSLKVTAQSDTVFFAFYNFLQKGDYPPEMAPISTTPYQGAAKTGGPPIIAEFQPNGPALLLTDVCVFIFASGMAFSELKAKALQRMYAMNTMHEDPVTILEEIYGNACAEIRAEDKQSLRNWAVDFVRKAHSESGVTNRRVLQGSEQWSRRFKALLEKSNDFKRDCDQSRESGSIEKMIQLIKHGGGSLDGIGDAYLAEIERRFSKTSLGSQRFLPPDEFDLARSSRRKASARPPLPESNTHSSGHEYLLSSQELNMIHQFFPELALIYERVHAEKMEVEAAAVRSKRKGKSKARDRTRNKGKDRARNNFYDDDYNDYGLTFSSSDESDSCFHSCYSCDLHGLVCRHYTERCVYCGIRRFPRGRHGPPHQLSFSSLRRDPLDNYAGPSSSYGGMDLMPGF